MSMEEKGHVCPVCKKYIFECQASYDICEICGWEDDEVQNRDHDYRGGANELSVNDSRLLLFLMNDDATSNVALELYDSYKINKRELKLKMSKATQSDKRGYIDSIKNLTESFVDELNNLYDSLESSEKY